MSTQDVRQLLVEKGISASRPRMAILNYMLTHYNHPTADDIFRDLRTEVSSLSLTTVYNTLKLFAEKGICLSLTINEKQVHFDGHTHPHSHFLCNRCGKVYDLPQPEIHLDASMLEGHNVTDVHCYYKGICSECMKKSN